MDKKYQVFISSTYRDLQDEREQVIKAVLAMGHIPVGMEMFSAADEDQWKIIARQIDEIDYYVVIVAHRYGSVTSEGVSFTEKEYDYAVSKGVPTLGFVIDNSSPWPNEYKEKPKIQKQLSKFKEKIQTRSIQFWKNKEDLHGKFSISLMKAIKDYPRTGWVRANEIAEPEVTKERTHKLTDQPAQAKRENLRPISQRMASSNPMNLPGRKEKMVESMKGTTLYERVLSIYQGIEGDYSFLSYQPILDKETGTVYLSSKDMGKDIGRSDAVCNDRILKNPGKYTRISLEKYRATPIDRKYMPTIISSQADQNSQRTVSSNPMNLPGRKERMVESMKGTLYQQRVLSIYQGIEGDYSFLNCQPILDKETGTVYLSITDMGKDIGRSDAVCNDRILKNPGRYTRISLEEYRATPIDRKYMPTIISSQADKT